MPKVIKSYIRHKAILKFSHTWYGYRLRLLLFGIQVFNPEIVFFFFFILTQNSHLSKVFRTKKHKTMPICKLRVIYQNSSVIKVFFKWVNNFFACLLCYQQNTITEQKKMENQRTSNYTFNSGSSEFSKDVNEQRILKYFSSFFWNECEIVKCEWLNIHLNERENTTNKTQTVNWM